MKVFLVEDDILQLDFTVETLQSRGVEVIATTESSGIVTKVLESEACVVILDLYMPNRDGLQVCKELKSDYRTKDIPIIFLSSSTNNLDKLKCFTTGCIDYLEKPIPVEELVSVLQKYCNLSNIYMSARSIAKRS